MVDAGGGGGRVVSRSDVNNLYDGARNLRAPVPGLIAVELDKVNPGGFDDRVDLGDVLAGEDADGQGAVLPEKGFEVAGVAAVPLAGCCGGLRALLPALSRR